jgi:hypothetical protein
MFNEKIIDLQSGTETIRPFTSEESAIMEATIAAAEAEAAKLQAETKAKEAARAALLDKLGITADEAKLLLGGN